MTCSWLADSSSRTVTTAWVAFACLAILVNASATTKYATDSTSSGNRRGRCTFSVVGTADALHHRRQRRIQPAVGQDRRRDAAHHVAQLDERILRVVVRLGDQLLGRGQVGVELGLRQPDGHGQRHQSRLHAVVQIAFDAVALGLRRRHRALPGIGERADLVLQRGRRRRRQQPAVDGGVNGRREDQDRHGRDHRDEGQQPGQRRRHERQPGVVVALPDRDRGGRAEECEDQQRKRDTRGKHVVGHPQVVVCGGLPEPGAADVQPQLMQPALDAGVGRYSPWRNADAEAEHRLAAHAFDAFDAAHQVDEHHDGQGEADAAGDRGDANDQDCQGNPEPHRCDRRAGEQRGRRHHADIAGGCCGIPVDGSGCRGGIRTRVGDCDHAFNLWTAGDLRHSVFPRTCRGKPP